MRESSALQNLPCIPSLRAGSRLTSVPRNANRFPLGRCSLASGRCARGAAAEWDRDAGIAGIGMPGLLGNPPEKARAPASASGHPGGEPPREEPTGETCPRISRRASVGVSCPAVGEEEEEEAGDNG